jgi:MFS family permease
MTQINKFYLASFLKNQTYFVPIIILFFQDLGLDYSQIFWIFTAGSIFAFILEIPTGILADLYGKRTSIIWSKFIIFLSFIAFALASNFWGLLLANLLFELGKVFAQVQKQPLFTTTY